MGWLTRDAGIRRCILDGDIDRALKYTKAYYPQVLQDHEAVVFKLRCRKFIEMVRKAAQMRAADDARRTNGHRPRAGSQDMDVDLNGADKAAWAETMDTDGSEQPTELMRLEQSMLEYGQVLEAQYANDSRKEVSNALGQIWALVAYSNPLKEPQVSHLLDRQGRAVVAEELNSAILCKWTAGPVVGARGADGGGGGALDSLAGQVVAGLPGEVVRADERAAGGTTAGRRSGGLCVAPGPDGRHCRVSADVRRRGRPARPRHRQTWCFGRLTGLFSLCLARLEALQARRA